jgi:hypothetical protein
MSRSDSSGGKRARRAGVLVVLCASGLLGLGLHCGSSNESVFPDGSACATVYKDKCGAPCTDDANCPTGLYCAADGRCFADCAPGGPGCSSTVTCSPRGRCGPDDPTPPILGGDTGTVTDAPIGDSCADIDVTLSKVKPTIVLLVDQSGSMTADFPPGSGASRWDVLRDALMDPDGGIVKSLQNDVSFGLTLYTWPSGVGACPLLSSVGVMINNYTAMNSVYADAAPIDNTPTAESVMGVVGFNDAGTLLDGGFAKLTTPGPKILLLATDGDPDTCAAPNSNGTQAPRDFTVWATTRTYDAGIKTYVLSIGADIDEAHQQSVANVGLGFNADAGDAAPLFRTSNRQQVLDALNQIILGVRSCKFTLNGAVVPGTEALGSVTLNGAPLGLNNPNGWKLSSPTEIEITGTACTTVKTSPSAKVSVRFPCGAIVPR